MSLNFTFNSEIVKSSSHIKVATHAPVVTIGISANPYWGTRFFVHRETNDYDRVAQGLAGVTSGRTGRGLCKIYRAACWYDEAILWLWRSMLREALHIISRPLVLFEDAWFIHRPWDIFLFVELAWLLKGIIIIYIKTSHNRTVHKQLLPDVQLICFEFVSSEVIAFLNPCHAWAVLVLVALVFEIKGCRLVWCAWFLYEAGSLRPDPIEEALSTFAALLHVVTGQYLLRWYLRNLGPLLAIFDFQSGVDALYKADSIARSAMTLVAQLICEVIASNVSPVPRLWDNVVWHQGGFWIFLKCLGLLNSRQKLWSLVFWKLFSWDFVLFKDLLDILIFCIWYGYIRVVFLHYELFLTWLVIALVGGVISREHTGVGFPA